MEALWSVKNLMTRYRVTPRERIPFTAEEEARKDAEEKEWFEVEAPAREMYEIRLHRTRLLSETDYLMLSDTPEISEAMKTYRQALRDIPASNTIYADVEWPDKPKE